MARKPRRYDAVPDYQGDDVMIHGPITYVHIERLDPHTVWVGVQVAGEEHIRHYRVQVENKDQPGTSRVNLIRS